MIGKILVFISLIVFSATAPPGEYEDLTNCPPDCESKIYCYGDFLKTIMLAEIHRHPKNFVDKKLLVSEEFILQRFEELKAGGTPNKEALITFEELYFADDIPKPCKLRDLEIGLNPKLLGKVEDPVYKRFVVDVQNIWQDLAVKIDEDVKDNPELHSMLYLPNCYIKAGGFFTSQFYWDSYWIIKGLIVTGMTETAKDMLLNFFHLIDKFNFVLNASRKYYSLRSQPPLLASMVKHYVDALPEVEGRKFLEENLLKIEKEFNWWMENRAVKFVKDDKEYIMYQYRQKSCNPRPEGYVKDYYTGEEFESDKERNYFYMQTHSVAESGLDFSTRQRRPNFYEKGYGTRKNLDITSLVPVELNAILAMNARLLSEWFEKLGNLAEAEKYRNISTTLIRYIDEVFRIEALGAWFDWDMKDNKHRQGYYATNLSPLYTLAYDTNKASDIGKGAVEYLKKSFIIHADGTPKFYGVPTSMINSPEQWDFINGWAPLQSFIVEGLNKTKQNEAVKVAQELAKIWVKTNWFGFQKHKRMFEKYDVVKLGTIGGGGTYTPQFGFGWTNGYLMVLMDLFGPILNHNDYNDFVADITGVNFNGDVRLR